MSSRLHPQADRYFHLFNRGCDRKTLFYDKQDYGFFLSRLKKYSKEHQLDLLAYCIMPNHYHCLLHVNTLCDHNSLSGMFHRLQTSYAKYFNRRYQHSGHVFQGRYQYKNVESTKYLAVLVCYIHVNPIEAQLVKGAEEWQYSSHSEYLNLPENPLLKRGLIDQSYHLIFEEFLSRREEKLAYIKSYLTD